MTYLEQQNKNPPQLPSSGYDVHYVGDTRMDDFKDVQAQVFQLLCVAPGRSPAEEAMAREGGGSTCCGHSNLWKATKCLGGLEIQCNSCSGGGTTRPTEADRIGKSRRKAIHLCSHLHKEPCGHFCQPATKLLHQRGDGIARSRRRLQR
jgi:hypothetical protein